MIDLFYLLMHCLFCVFYVLNLIILVHARDVILLFMFSFMQKIDLFLKFFYLISIFGMSC
jgi:hypothetical protein